MTFKVKYANFRQITRSRTVGAPIAALADADEIATGLLEALFPTPKGVRSIGITLSSLDEGTPSGARQLRLDV